MFDRALSSSIKAGELQKCRARFLWQRNKKQIMKVSGIVLLFLGIAMFVFQGIRGTQKEKVIDVGPVEISKQVERSDSWQLYMAGGIAVVAGLILVLANKRRVAV